MRWLPFALVTLAAVAHAEGVKWQGGTMGEALQKARAEHKWVLVEEGATWCGPYHEMDEKVYSRDDVASAFADGYVALHYDGEKGEGKELHQRYHIVGFPTLLVLGPDGSEVDRVMGFVEARELLSLLESFRRGQGALSALEKRAESSHDPALAAEVARRHALRGDPRAPSEIEKVVALDPQNRAGRAAEGLLVLGKYYYLRGTSDYAHAVTTLERLARSFPDAPQTGEVAYNLAIAQHGLGDDARALATLDGWLAADKSDERYNAYCWCCFKNDFGRAHAIDVARTGLAAHPRTDALWDTLAELYAKDGKLPDAAAAERKALEVKPADRYYAAQLERFGGKRP